MTEFEATQGAIDLTEELGIDLAEVEGSGDEGKIYKKDVEEMAVEQVAQGEVAEESDSDFYTIVRGISKINRQEANFFPSAQVDAYVRSWLNEGFELADTHYLAESPEGYIMMYILVK